VTSYILCLAVHTGRPPGKLRVRPRCRLSTTWVDQISRDIGCLGLQAARLLATDRARWTHEPHGLDQISRDIGGFGLQVARLLATDSARWTHEPHAVDQISHDIGGFGLQAA